MTPARGEKTPNRKNSLVGHDFGDRRGLRGGGLMARRRAERTHGGRGWRRLGLFLGLFGGGGHAPWSCARSHTTVARRPRPWLRAASCLAVAFERRSGSGSSLGFGGGRGRFGFLVGVFTVDLPSPSFHAASHSLKPAGGAQSPPSGSVIPSWARTTRHTIAPCFALRQLSQRLSSKGISFGIFPFSLASAMVFASRLRSYFCFCFCASRVDGGGGLFLGDARRSQKLGSGPQCYFGAPRALLGAAALPEFEDQACLWPWIKGGFPPLAQQFARRAAPERSQRTEQPLTGTGARALEFGPAQERLLLGRHARRSAPAGHRKPGTAVASVADRSAARANAPQSVDKATSGEVGAV